VINQFNASLWGDEAWATTLAVKSIPEIIRIVARDTSPPFYYLLDHIWMRIFGTSEVSIRTLTFIFFLLTVWFVYLIGKLLWDKPTGIWAGLLAFTNPFLFKYAFEGRMYALLALTCAASMYFYLGKNKWGHILSTTAALYTHHFAIFLILAQLFWHLIKNWKQSFKKLIFSFKNFLIIGLLYLPWLYPLYYQTSLVGSGFWLEKPALKTVTEVSITFFTGFGRQQLKKAALVILGLILVSRQWRQKREAAFFALNWFFIPMVLIFGVSQVFQSVFFDRYMLFMIPGGLLVLASNRSRISRLFLIIFLGIMLFNNWHYFTHPEKRPFRDFASLVKKNITEADFLINYQLGAHHLFEAKYYNLRAPIYAPGDELPFYVGTALMEKSDIVKEIPSQTTRLGVITSGNLEQVKIKGYQMSTSFQVNGLKFAHFVPVQ
jgi:uncharacterized membrane protein